MSDERHLRGYRSILFPHRFRENIEFLSEWKHWLNTKVWLDENGKKMIDVSTFSHEGDHIVLLEFYLLESAEREFEMRTSPNGQKRST